VCLPQALQREFDRRDIRRKERISVFLEASEGQTPHPELVLDSFLLIIVDVE
jgi:hypothetical protein